MAFRRRGRRPFRRMRRGASAFAPARAAGGSLHWEAAGTTCWSLAEDVFPLQSLAYPVTCDGDQFNYETRGLILIPLNQTRGTVTLRRVRGFIGHRCLTASIDDNVSVRDRFLHWMLQLVPREPTAVETPAGNQLLSGNLAPDQENNRILAQWTSPFGEHGFWQQSVGVNILNWCREIDVKSQRRFTRSEWALVLSITTTVAGFDTKNRVYANLRMLFSAGDGL